MGLLTKIRHNLIVLALKKLSQASTLPPLTSRVINGRSTLVTDENIELLGNLLFLDPTLSESQQTTPLAFAIGRLQTFVQAVRLGTERRTSPAQLNEETWAWLKSYGTWHAAMMVSVYPENFLIPEIRRNVTPEFRAVADSFADNLPGRPEEVKGGGIFGGNPNIRPNNPPIVSALPTVCAPVAAPHL